VKSESRSYRNFGWRERKLSGIVSPQVVGDRSTVLVLLEEVPVGGHDTVIKPVEDGGAHVEVRVSAAGTAVDNDGVDRLAVGLDLDSLTTVVAVVLVVETLADGNDHVAVDRVPTTLEEENEG
jgi:hypothetical protein